MEVLADAVGESVLADSGLEIDAVLEDDAGRLFRAERAAIEERRRVFERKRKRRAAVGDRAGRRRVDFDVENYHNVSEVQQYLRDLEAQYNFTSTEVIGETFEGRELLVLKVCRRKGEGEGAECGAEEGKPLIWVDAGN